MAHSNNSIITGKFSGMLGDELVFRDWDGGTVVAKAPAPRKGEASAEQKEIQDKFLMATRFGKAATEDEGLKAGYAAVLKPRQTVYIRAVKDFLTPPVVSIIDTRKYKGLIGDKIIIRAIDDFRVTGVRVEITDADGVLFEDGIATTMLNGLDYSYTATTAIAALAGIVIKAVATDVPGNEGGMEVVL